MLPKSLEKETKVRHVEKIEWCTGADDWGDGDDDGGANEENGNLIDNPHISDEEDESTSMGSDPIVVGFNNLGIDDKNANAPGACAVERSPSKPSAEIEGGEAEVCIMLDSPPMPQKDIFSLLKPTKLREISNDVMLRSFYISVDTEKLLDSPVSDHIRELIMDYESRDEIRGPSKAGGGSPDEPRGAVGGADDIETYERGIPLHGDVVFHQFVQRIQQNPGQILRYSRFASPLLIAPLRDVPQKCQNCGGDVMCEVQILPTLIPKIRLTNGDDVTLDFGNVLVYTCVKSCYETPDKMRFEAVVVQQEEASTH